LTSTGRVNQEDTTNNSSSQIKNKMLFTFFEIIFYFYYRYFTSSWNKISVSYWKWDAGIPKGYTGPEKKQTLRLYCTNHTKGAEPFLGSHSCTAIQHTSHGLRNLTV
jgi:hypothetical protein